MRTAVAVRANVVEQTSNVAESVAAPHADHVDRHSRFPVEAFEALQACGLLGTLVPVELGGIGASLTEAGQGVTALASACASSGVILATHHLQVACLVRHGHTDRLQEFLADVAQQQLLLTSAIRQEEIEGDVDAGECLLDSSGRRFSLKTHVPFTSYGTYADGILVAARRHLPDAADEECLAVCDPPGLSLELTNRWETVGLRGTCGQGIVLRAQGGADMVFPAGYGRIAAQTVHPLTQILWACVWLGIARSAFDRARHFVQFTSHSTGTCQSGSSIELVDLVVCFQQLEAVVSCAIGEFDRLDTREEAGVPAGFSIHMHSVKLSASALVLEIVTRAMKICGSAGYTEGTPYSLSRQLRDAFSAAGTFGDDRRHAERSLVSLDPDDAAWPPPSAGRPRS